VSDRRAAGAGNPGQAAGQAAGRAASRAALSDQGAARDEDGYPGKRFGLPEAGPRSVAGVGRRLLALIIDWLACLLITSAILRGVHHGIPFSVAIGQARGWTLGVFAAEVFVLTALTGFTLGKRLLGIRVARIDGRPVGLVSALLRTVLLLLVVPPLVLDKDLRGLHDKAAKTIVIRL
jgi:uncharacterized RDD family membrane protein YckC